MIEIGIIKDTPANKIITIRDKNQVIKAKYAIGEDDILKYSLMSEHYIEIYFYLNRNALFKRSDYIEWEGEKYTLRKNYQPEQINKYKYKYTLKFEAVEMFFQDMQYWYLGQGLKESELRMTGNPEYFIKYAVENANRYFKTTDFNIGTIEPTEIKDITFEINTNTFDALTQIADAYDAEWYITGKTIHLLNKISFGDEVDFETDVSVLSMKREEGESTTRYTRLLALGSTRNIPYDYRETTPNEAVDVIYQKRLRIPASKGDVIDAYPNMSPDEVVEGTVVFDEVYPKRVGTIEAVGTIEYKETNTDTGVVTLWDAYKFKDSGIIFKEEYMLPGQELKLRFTSGDLNGRDFALIFHKSGFSSADNSQFYEIVRTDEFGNNLPNDVMKPKIGDQYVLYGFNIALVSDQYVPAGELELYDVASTWQQKQLRDTGVYECPTAIGYFRDHQMDLAIGQKVRLIQDIGSNRNQVILSKLSTYAAYNVLTGASGNIISTKTVRASTAASKATNLTLRVLEYQPTAGEIYTISGKMQLNDNPVTNDLWMYKSGSTYATIISFFVDDATGYFKITSRYPATFGDWLFHTSIQANAGDTITIDSLKFEKGNKATSWTPAPEDVEGAIRSSRIMGFEKQLNNKYDAIYTVGDNSTYSFRSDIEQQIKELQISGITYQATGGNGVYVIKQFDTTRPTDFNVYSAIASDAKYFNKQTGGSVQGDTTFAKDVQVQGTTAGDVFQNSTFTAGQFGSGFQLKRDSNGQSYMEVDNLMVRRETVFNRLTIAEIKAVGGTILLSLASMILSKVEVKTSTWKCFFDTADATIPNDFAIGDQAICRKFTGKEVKYYWALVTAVGSDYVELSKTDKDGSGIPTIGDEVVQLGNRNDVNRQYAIMLSAYGSAAPSINQYSGINSYDLTGKEITAISPKGNKFTGSFAVSTNGTTAPVYKERKTFVPGTAYYLDDRVSYLGAYWVCIVNTTITTPSEGSTTWRKDTTGTTDINNAVDGINIGGVNLLPKSGRFKQDTGNVIANATGTTVSVDTTTLYEGENTLKIIGNNGAAFADWIQLQGNTTYTYSIIAKSSATIQSDDTSPLHIWLSETKVSGHLETIIARDATITTLWKRCWITFKTPNTDKIYYFKPLIYKLGTSTVWLSSMKLEIGNKATDWSPAINDVNNQISDAENRVRTEYKADFVILDTKIASKVSQTDFNSLGQRVSTTESNVTQLSNSITSVVETVNNIETDTRNYIILSRLSTVASYNVITGVSGNIISTRVVRASTVANKATNLTLQVTGYQPTAGEVYTISGKMKLNGNPVTNDLWMYKASTTYATPITFFVDDATGYFKITSKAPNNFGVYLLHTSIQANAGDIITIEALKFERGYKPTSWTPAPEDVDKQIQDAQTSANNAQSTADSKNKSYYQDTVPTAPSGGNKVGDLWYKTSLVDSSGNINSDTSKNLWQLQYRWDGTAWRQVNWSVSKSKIEQTDSRITSIVEKTGIDSLGNGETLYSKINQTADNITLEVSKIQIGSTNLVRVGIYDSGIVGYSKTNGKVLLPNSLNRIILTENPIKTAGQFSVSFWYKVESFDVSFILDPNINDCGLTTIPVTSNKGWTFYSSTTNVSLYINSLGFIDFEGIKGSAKVTISDLTVVRGNKPLQTWTPAPEDVSDSIIQTNAELAVLDSKIALKASQADFNNLGNRVSSAESAISLTPGQINLAVSNIQVGGNNIIPATNQGVKGWSKTSQNGVVDFSETSQLGVRAVKATTTTVSTGYHVLLRELSTGRALIKNNKQYVIACDVYCTFATSAGFTISDTSSSNTLVSFGSFAIPANAWTRVELTATTNSTTTTNQQLYITGFNKLGSVIFANLGIYEGNKAPYPWKDSAGDAVNEVKAGINIDANKVSVFGQTLEVNADLIAQQINADGINIANGGFEVAENPDTGTMEVTTRGNLELLWDGDTSKPVNRVAVIDASSGRKKTKVMIVPTDIRALENIGGSDGSYPVVQGGGAKSDSTTAGRTEYLSPLFVFTAGNMYDVFIPPILLRAEYTGWEHGNPDLSKASYMLILDNLSTGSAIVVTQGQASLSTNNVVTSNQSFMINALQAGTYRLRIVLQVLGGYAEASYSIPSNTKLQSLAIVESTEIGKNGFTSVFSSTHYFHLTTKGLFVRMGAIGFRITEGGVQKSSNQNNPTPTWINL